MKWKRTYRIAKYVMYRETMLDTREILLAFNSSFMGIGLIGYLQSKYLGISDNLFLIGSFGASAVLVYGIPTSPLAKPRNVIGGHVLSALIGVTVAQFFLSTMWLAAALTVALCIVCMQVTRTLHPPGGATGMIACIGSPKVLALGYWYVLSPVLVGVLILMLVAIVTNPQYVGKATLYRNKKFWKLAFKKSEG